MYHRRSKGFTLIQLPLVIAIIAILAAILFPVFAKARDKARQATCLSNVKQLTLALLMYAEDYDEGLPAATGWGNYGWWGRIRPYTKSSGILHCPAAQIP